MRTCPVAYPVDNFAESNSRSINEKVLYPGHNETFYPGDFWKNWCSPLKKSIFSMVLHLRNNSAIWLLRFRFKSSAIDTWYTGFSRHPFKLTWVSQKFLSFQLPTTISSTPLNAREKQNLMYSPNFSIEPTMERGLIIELEKKPYCTYVSIVWWQGYRDYRAFPK